MIQNLNVNIWFKTVIIIGLLLLLFISWAWLAGVIFMVFNGFDIRASGPLTLYQYWYYYSDVKLIQIGLVISIFLSTLLIASPCLLVLISKRKALFGQAHWAKSSHIKKAGLYSSEGIVVGIKKQWLGLSPRYLVFGGNQHVLMAAPTRSGKGVSIVIPNLLHFKDSVVVLDIKQENWAITAGFRAAHGQACYLLNLAPRDFLSHRWNPLYYIDNDPHFRINDIQKIGQMLFPKVDNEAPVWQASARSLWLGLILYLIETHDLPVTMGEALRQLTLGDDHLSTCVKQRQSSHQPLSQSCYLAIKEYLDTPEKTRGSIRKSFTSALELLYNPVIDAVTSGNDFNLRDLRKQRMSIYVSVTPDDLDRLAPLINLFFQQLIDLNTRTLPEQDNTLRYQCLLLMDEFTAIGKINVLAKGISYIAGYGLRMLPIIQSPAQLRETYGTDTAESFMDNHALHIVFAPKNIKVAKELSETLGTKTVKHKSKSRQLMGKSNHTENASDHSRALLLPQEIKQLDQKTEIILLEHYPPIICQKITWYQDKRFSLRGNNQNHIQWLSPQVPKLNLDKQFKEKNISQLISTQSSITLEDFSQLDDFNTSDVSIVLSSDKIQKNDIIEHTLDQLVQQFFSEILPNTLRTVDNRYNIPK